MLHLVQCRWPNPTASRKKEVILVDRSRLSKRRWRALASDGTEFGFDLEVPLRDGDIIFETETIHYMVNQEPEALLEINLGDRDETARLAWSLGNLHFPIAIHEKTLRVMDDPAIRLFLEREQIPWRAVNAVFHPLKSGATHEHAH